MQWLMRLWYWLHGGEPPPPPSATVAPDAAHDATHVQVDRRLTDQEARVARLEAWTDMLAQRARERRPDD